MEPPKDDHELDALQARFQSDNKLSEEEESNMVQPISFPCLRTMSNVIFVLLPQDNAIASKHRLLTKLQLALAEPSAPGAPSLDQAMQAVRADLA